MRSLIWAFAGRMYHIFGNLVLRLNWSKHNISKWQADVLYKNIYNHKFVVHVFYGNAESKRYKIVP